MISGELYVQPELKFEVTDAPSSGQPEGWTGGFLQATSLHCARSIMAIPGRTRQTFVPTTFRDYSVRRLGRLFGETFATTLVKIGWQQRAVAPYVRAKQDRRHASVASDGEAGAKCGKSDLSAARSHIQSLQRRIAALEAENAALTASSNTFGDLAERFNRRLREENRNT